MLDVRLQGRSNKRSIARSKSLLDNLLFSKPPQFQPLLKYWGHLKNFYSDTTNYGVDGKKSPVTPQIVVLMAKIHLRHHKMWCQRRILAIDTTICGVRVEIFQVPPIFQQGLKLWGFGKQKLIWKTLIPQE